MKLVEKKHMAGIKGNILKIFILVMFLCNNLGYGSSPLVDPPKSTEIQKWVKRNFAKGKVPPFSFTYGGKSSNTFITDWEYSARKLKNPETDKENFLYTYSDRTSGLAVRCEVTVFDGFQAAEWVLKFENTSNENTPIIEKVAAVHNTFTSEKEGAFVLHHAKGSNAGRDDFMPLIDSMKIGKRIKMMPVGARGSSDKTAFPFFNIEKPDNTGVMVAVGWTGKWYADLLQNGKNGVELRAGMENLSLYLLPKEEIRSPKICLLFWKGKDRMVGHNRFRQFVLSHHTRKIDGKFVDLPLSAGISRGGPSPCNEFTCLTESYAIATIERFKQFDIIPEVCWVDAGWYEGDVGWWQGVGNWVVDKKRFPNGLKPISDAAHNIGSKFLLWFELERVRKGTRFEKEHRDWLLEYPGTKNEEDIYNYNTYMFDLGNQEARLWLTDYVVDMLKKEGVDYYRQDFNWVDAEGSWQMKDSVGRVGISEIRYIEGLYAFWDGLLEKLPHLVIDNCASGGRRIDLESISRSSPLWRSDYGFGEPEGYQNHTYGLNFYLPLHGTGLFNSSEYDFRSSMSSAMVLFWDLHSSNSSISQMQNCIRDFKRLRPYYYADYYPLTPSDNLLRDDKWLAYQMNRPDKGDGIIMAFRRPNSDDQEIDLYFTGLDEQTTYEVKDKDTGEIIIKTGKELSEGMRITLEKAPSSICLVYNKK